MDGRPLHHQHSATSLEYDPTSGTSTFFVTTLEKFEQLDGQQVQDVFSHRSILIPGPAPKGFLFDRQGLAKLGSLSVERTVQGIFQIHITKFVLLTSFQSVPCVLALETSQCYGLAPWRIF